MLHVQGLVAYSDALYTPGEHVAAVVRGPGGLAAQARLLLPATGSAGAERAECLLAGKLARLAADLAGCAGTPLVVFVDHQPLTCDPTLNSSMTAVWLRRRSDRLSCQVDTATRMLLRGHSRPLVRVDAAGRRLLWASGPRATEAVRSRMLAERT